MVCEMIFSDIKLINNIWIFLSIYLCLSYFSLYIDIDFYLNFFVEFFWFNVLEVIKNMVSWFILNNWRAFIDLL